VAVDLGLAGKVVLVTGGSRGIGRSIALGFAAEGCRLVICARGAERLEATADELRQASGPGSEVLAIAADLTVSAGRQAVFDRTLAAFDRLDVLINNVGGGGADRFMTTSDEEWATALDLTLWPSIQLSRMVVPTMRQQGGGVITMISSIYGREWGGRPAYMTVKAAENALTKAMARELAPDNIRVNAVAPGSIRFPGGSWDRRCEADPEGMARFVQAEMPLGRFGRPEEVADVVVFLASERASLMVGACVNVDGGQSRSLI
jgi:3-oxoacyl-[acyl-carrier protein] reductase